MSNIDNDLIEPQQLPPGAVAFNDIAFGPHERQRYDLFLPPDHKSGPRPLVAYIHGGSWRMRNKSAIRMWYLLEHGYALASIGYRLSQHAVFPAQRDDVNAALADIAARASSFPVRSQRIALCGLSAGGHLAALAGLGAGRPAAALPKIAGVIDFYGVSDILALAEPSDFPRDFGAPDSSISRLLGATMHDRPDLASEASPVRYVSPEAPPFLLIHGDVDPVVPISQSRLLAERLQQAGATAQLLTVPGAGHAGPLFDAPPVRRAVLDFLESLDL
jgi:acetyl esterase/lipase